MGGRETTRVPIEHAGLESVPWLLWQPDRREFAIDLEHRQEFLQGQLRRVGRAEHIVDLVGVGLCETFLSGDDEFIGTEDFEAIVLFVGRVGENYDLGSECFGE